MAANPYEPDVFTVAEAAAYLRVGERHVREMVRGGLIFGQKIGKAWRISAQDVRRLAHGEAPDADPLVGLQALLPGDWRERLPQAIAAAMTAGLDVLLTTDPDGGATRRKGGTDDLEKPHLEVARRDLETKNGPRRHHLGPPRQ